MPLRASLGSCNRGWLPCRARAVHPMETATCLLARGHATAHSPSTTSRPHLHTCARGHRVQADTLAHAAPLHETTRHMQRQTTAVRVAGMGRNPHSLHGSRRRLVRSEMGHGSLPAAADLPASKPCRGRRGPCRAHVGGLTGAPVGILSGSGCLGVRRNPRNCVRRERRCRHPKGLGCMWPCLGAALQTILPPMQHEY